MIHRNGARSDTSSSPPLSPRASPAPSVSPLLYSKTPPASHGNEEDCSVVSCSTCGRSSIFDEQRDPLVVQSLEGKNCRRFLFVLTCCMIVALPNLDVSVKLKSKRRNNSVAPADYELQTPTALRAATPASTLISNPSTLFEEPQLYSNVGGSHEASLLKNQLSDFDDHSTGGRIYPTEVAAASLVESQPVSKPHEEPRPVEVRPIEEKYSQPSLPELQEEYRSDEVIPVQEVDMQSPPEPQEEPSIVEAPPVEVPTSSSGATDALFLDTLNLKESGDGWQAWNRIDAIGDQDRECIQAPYIPSNTDVSSTNICLHPIEEDIWISKSIRDIGRWKDCDRLSKKWNELAAADDLGPNPIYVEIGGNIGTCVMEMLLVTDAKIVVFEPLPANVALLSRTLLSNDEALRNRVKLFPIALAEEGPAKNVIYARKNNAGNAVVGDKNILQPEEIGKPVDIFVETLEDVFSNVNLVGDENNKGDGPEVSIGLMKLDVEGFECHVLEGGKRVFEHTRNLKTEFLRKLLRVQGCSSKRLSSLIADVGMEPTEVDKQDVMFTQASLIPKDDKK